MSETIAIKIPADEEPRFKNFTEFYKFDCKNRERLDSQTNAKLSEIIKRQADTQFKKSKIIQFGQSFFKFEEEVRLRHLSQVIDVNYKMIDATTGQYYKYLMDRYKYQYAYKFVAQNPGLIDDNDLIYITFLKPTGKVIQFGVNALLMTHIIQLMIFWRKKLRTNWIMPMHYSNHTNPVFIQNRAIFRQRYLEIFPLPLTSLTFLFMGLKLKWNCMCSEWGELMFQKYWLDHKLYVKPCPVGTVLSQIQRDSLQKALIQQSELLFEQRPIAFKRKYAIDFSLNKSSLYEQNQLISQHFRELQKDPEIEEKLVRESEQKKEKREKMRFKYLQNIYKQI